GGCCSARKSRRLAGPRTARRDASRRSHAGVLHRIPDRVRRDAAHRPGVRRLAERSVFVACRRIARMIDTHCHLLWRLDDGPNSLIASIDLARALRGQGVEAALCTPHYSPRFPTQPAATRARFNELRRSLGALSVGLQIELGAEVASTLALSVPLDE